RGSRRSAADAGRAAESATHSTHAAAGWHAAASTPARARRAAIRGEPGARPATGGPPCGAVPDGAGAPATEQRVLRRAGMEPWIHGATRGGPDALHVPRQRRPPAWSSEAVGRVGATGERPALQ